MLFTGFTCECTTAQMNKATLYAWQCFSLNILDYIKECFFSLLFDWILYIFDYMSVVCLFDLLCDVMVYIKDVNHKKTKHYPTLN